MARDGLLPKVFATLHTKFRTPWIGTIILGGLIAVAAAFLPIEILGDMVSLGTAVAFAIVCISVIWLRAARPDLVRPFTVPFGPVLPVLGIIFSLVMVWPLISDIVGKALTGDPIPAILLSTYLAIGAVIYIGYGLRHSRLAKGLGPLEEGDLPTELEAVGHGLDEKH
jgi:APA family basic amino acid/polyamine antiporter